MTSTPSRPFGTQVYLVVFATYINSTTTDIVNINAGELSVILPVRVRIPYQEWNAMNGGSHRPGTFWTRWVG
jgi:hypothetical protein